MQLMFCNQQSFPSEKYTCFTNNMKASKKKLISFLKMKSDLYLLLLKAPPITFMKVFAYKIFSIGFSITNWTVLLIFKNIILYNLCLIKYFFIKNSLTILRDYVCDDVMDKIANFNVRLSYISVQQLTFYENTRPFSIPSKLQKLLKTINRIYDILAL